MTLNEFAEWLKKNTYVTDLHLHNLMCSPEAGCSIDEIECVLGDPHCEHMHPYRFDTKHGYNRLIIDVQNEWYQKYNNSPEPDPFPSVEETLSEFVRRIEEMKKHPIECHYCEIELETGKIVLE